MKGKKEGGGGVRGVLEGDLQMSKRGERLKGILPFHVMKRSN